MADDERSAFERVQDRLGGLERLFERLDERGKGWLGKDDANRIMDVAAEGDRRLREDVFERWSEFRIEVRDAFKHAEKEYAAALYRATTESEGRLQAKLKDDLSTSVAMAVATMLSERFPIQEKRNGIHPVIPYGVGGSLVSTAVLTVLWVLGLIPAGAH